jgi:Fur family transcriptional regulator, iron response regulator
MSDHAHFFVESAAQLIDIPAGAIRIQGLPDAPAGMCISHVDVVVHLAPK